MKKMNRKGFTLIELLAVIVVLAIVMVIAIPSVLTSIDSSRKQAFEASANSIASWFETQYGYCKLGSTGVTPEGVDLTDYKSIDEDDCTINTTTSSDSNKKVFKAAGASLEDYTVKVSVGNTGRACVELSVKSTTSGEPAVTTYSGKFSSLKNYVAKSTGCTD